MDTIKYRVTSTSPLLMHNPSAMMGGNGGEVKAKKIPTPEEEAAAGAYRMEGGQLYIPVRAFRGSILNGCKGLRIGKIAAKTVFAGALFAAGEQCPLVDPDTGKPLKNYEIDVQRAVITSTKAAVMRARPRVDRWACELELEHDPDFLEPSQIDSVFATAGQIVGVLDYRPAKGGPYGKYKVERID